MNTPTQAKNPAGFAGRTSLTIKYVSVVDYSLIDPFEAVTIIFADPDPTIPLNGLQYFQISPFEYETRRYIQIDCTVQYDIRKDRPEYQVLRRVKEGGDQDKEYNGALYKRTAQYETFVHKLIEYLIWRKKLFINPPFAKIVDTQSCVWTLEGVSIEHNARKQWYAIGEPFEINVADKSLNYEDFSDFPELIDQNTTKPLYHELLDEANRLVLHEQYRGAFLMLYTALEVGTKKLVGLEKPETEWIVNNTQGPKLEDIYIQYINNNERTIVDDDGLVLLRNMTSKRNNIAHQGSAVDGATFRRYRNFVREILYKIDTELGFKWAETEQESTFYTQPYINFIQTFA